MSSMAVEAASYYAKHDHYALSLTAMGVDPKALSGSYYEVLDAVGFDDDGAFLVVVPRAAMGPDEAGRLHLATNRITWD